MTNQNDNTQLLLLVKKNIKLDDQRRNSRLVIGILIIFSLIWLIQTLMKKPEMIANHMFLAGVAFGILFMTLSLFGAVFVTHSLFIHKSIQRQAYKRLIELESIKDSQQAVKPDGEGARQSECDRQS